MEQVKPDLNKVLLAVGEIMAELDLLIHKEETQKSENLEYRIERLISAGNELDSSSEILKLAIGHDNFDPLEHNLFEFKDEWPGFETTRGDIYEAIRILEKYVYQRGLKPLNVYGETITQIKERLKLFRWRFSEAYEDELIDDELSEDFFKHAIPGWVLFAQQGIDRKTGARDKTPENEKQTRVMFWMDKDILENINPDIDGWQKQINDTLREALGLENKDD